MQPYEVIAAPLELYLAPVGEAFPLIDTDPPGGNWVLVGASGSQRYDEDGVAIAHNEEIEDFRMLGTTGPVKSSRTEEELMVTVILHDLTLEQYAYALNFNAVTDTPEASGVAGFREVDLYKGRTVNTRALLARGPSPYDEALFLQYEIPRVRAGGEPEVIWAKGEPAGLELSFMALIDLNAATDAKSFGVLRASDAAALP